MDHRNVEWWHVIISSSLRYFLFAGMAYLIFYKWKGVQWMRFKIQKYFPKAFAVRNELLYSASTIFIFALVIYTVLFSPLRAFTQLYTDIYAYPVAYFWISIAIMVVLHDAYFYWIHRFMHGKKIFRFVHHIHHRSHNPTPLAAFSFHPIEAILEIGILPLIVYTMPVHKLALGIFGLGTILINVMGHLGFELFPKAFVTNTFLRFFTTSTHHNMHHHRHRGNYGLYFTVWDRLLGTNQARYEAEFTRITDERSSQKMNTPMNKSGRSLKYSGS